MSRIFMRFPGFKRKAVTLSYDDGVIFDEQLINIMRKNGLKGTFNISTGLLNEGNPRRLTKENVVKLYTESGNEVAVHGKYHVSLADVPLAMAVDDVLKDRQTLEEWFDKIVIGMAYANGSFDDNVVDIVKKCGIEYARTTVSTEKFDIPENWLMIPTTCHHKNPRLMELAKKFIESPESKYYWSKKPQLFYLWGHSYEFNDEDNWEIIEEFATYMGNRDNVWYATNGEIYNYVKAYDSLMWGADGKRVYNPSVYDIFINYYDNEYVIHPGDDVKI